MNSLILYFIYDSFVCVKPENYFIENPRLNILDRGMR